MSKHEHLKCNLEKSIFKRKKGFTLVELIVVITILAILGTISFIAFQNYTKSARDGTRISDINMIKQNLGIFITEKSFYPNPDNGTMIKYDGALVRTQGTVGDTVTINLGRMSKKPVDPLTESEYTYSVANNRVEYQIGAIAEEGAMAYIPNLLTNNAYAASGKKAIAMVTGTYNEKFLKVNTGGTNYILALPSIISADITDTDVTSIVANNKMVFNNYSNLPDSYKNNGYDMTGGFDFNPSNIVAFSGAAGFLDSEANKLAFATNLEEIYKNSIIKSEGTYQEILNTTNDPDKVFLVNNYIANNIGGITGQVSAIVYRNCTTTNGETILHGETKTAYTENLIAYGNNYQCKDITEQRTCNDGTLSGHDEYKYLICQDGDPDICIASGSYLTISGHTYSIPELAHLGTATNITSSDVNIDNGVFNYTLTSIECMDGTLINEQEDLTPTLVSCNEHYNPVGNTCIAATFEYVCQAKPELGTIWNIVDRYTQTWDGSDWSPASTLTVHNDSSSDIACNYKCDTNYTWDGINCLEIINGVCGSSNGLNLSIEPTVDTLCNSGTASTVTGTGPWTWTCDGINGGTTANCSTTNYCQVGGVGIGCEIQ